MTASSKNTPSRVERHKSGILSKLSSCPDKATKDDLILVGGSGSGRTMLSLVPPALIPVNGSTLSSVSICWSTKVRT